MAAYDALTEEPPPSRNWDNDEDDAFFGKEGPPEPGHFQMGTKGGEWSEEDVLKPLLLVIAASRASTVLLQQLRRKSTLLGEIILPAYQPASPSLPRIPTKRVYPIVSLEPSSPAGVVVALCPQPVPAERAFEWTRAIFERIQPQSVLVLGSMPAGSFRSPLPPTEVPLYRLQTDAAKVLGNSHPEHQQGWPLPGSTIENLPSGTVADGLPAAVLSYCQLRHIPGVLLVAISISISSEPGIMRRLAAAVWPSLEGALGEPLDVHSVVAAAAAALEKEASVNPAHDIYT